MRKELKKNDDSYCEFDGNCKPQDVKKKLDTPLEFPEVDRPEAGQDKQDWVADSRGAINTKEEKGTKPGKDYCSWDNQCGGKE